MKSRMRFCKVSQNECWQLALSAFCFAYQFYDATKIDSTDRQNSNWNLIIIYHMYRNIVCRVLIRAQGFASNCGDSVHKHTSAFTTYMSSVCLCIVCWSKSRTEASRDPQFSWMAINWLNLIIQSADKIMLVRVKWKWNLHRMFSANSIGKLRPVHVSKFGWETINALRGKNHVQVTSKSCFLIRNK